jgi:hypothetical protein
MNDKDQSAVANGTGVALTPEQLARKAEAEVATAEAKARQAQAEADDAENSSAKTAADARKTAADAVKTEHENADHEDPSAKAQREAASAEAVAKAEKEAAEARRAVLSALIPDFGSVDKSTIEVKDGPALKASALMYQALQPAAATVADQLIKVQGIGSAKVLVTSDADLASADAVYRDVSTGIDQLIAAATKLIADTAPDQRDLVPVTDFVAAIASAVPGVLSLLTAHRTLTTASVAVSDLAASAAVAGALKARDEAKDMTVVHDDFRLVPGAGVYTSNTTLSDRRQTLNGRKIELTTDKSVEDANLAAANAAKAAVQKLIKAVKGTVPPDLEQRLHDAERDVAEATNALARLSLLLGLIDGLMSSIDQYVVALRTVPASGGRSPLATAALHEQLHAEGGYNHVLLVKAQPGQAEQLIDNRPLWFADRFSTVVDVTLTYMLIRATDSAVETAGSATKTATARGRIGDKPTITFGS